MSLGELKDRIKDAPISTIIGHYIPLRRKGSSLEAICPFHADTKPSLKVNDDKGLYRCFACSAGGDAITFVTEFKKVDFKDALKEIAEILGLPFEEYQAPKKKNPRVEMAFRVLNASLKLYRKYATQCPPHFQQFLEKRQFSQETIEKFQIGYAPHGNVLLKFLQSKTGADQELAVKTALDIGIVKYNPEKNSTYDFYRDRAMFPIHDHSGQVRGYSARVLEKDQGPKYLNSGESFIFDKGSILFGFYFAKSSIRAMDQVILAEGNIDVITMHQYGFTQTVGAMGTALSDHAARVLANLTKNVILGLDGDDAGKQAAQKFNTQFMTLGVLPKFLDYSPAKDPDEFLLMEGRLALLERIEKAPTLLDKLIEESIPNPVPETVDLKLQALHRIFELVAPLKEDLSASERVVNAAKVLNLRSDSGTIIQDYKDYLSRQKEKTFTPITKPRVQVQEEEAQLLEQEAQELQEVKPNIELGPVSKSERVFLREILCHPEFLTHIKIDDFLAYIGHSEVKKLVQWLVKIYLEIDDSEYVRIVQDELQDAGYSKEVREIGADALFHHGNKYNEKVIKRMLKDYHLMLRMEQLKTKRRELVERQKSSPTQNEVDLILSEISKLDKEMLSLKT
jgi:DNA primase